MPENFNHEDRLLLAYETTVRELEELFKAKNHDYGASVDITFLLFGESAQLVRIWDKLLRVTKLTLIKDSNDEQKVKNETILDTLKDLANYTLIAIAQRSIYNEKNQGYYLGEVFKEFACSRSENEVRR